jgi:PST family polysaccharide transporter
MVARLLSPADFGVVAGAATFTGIVALVAEFGLGSAIVARPYVSATEQAQLLGASILGGLAALLTCTLLSVPVALALGLTELRGLLPVIGCTLALAPVNSVFLSVMRREMAFAALARIEMTKAMAHAAFSLAFSALGFAYWALVLSELSATVLMAALLYHRTRIRPAWPRRAELGDWYIFSRDLVVSRAAWYAYSNADFAVVGRRFGAAVLGDYSMAFTLVSMPVDKLATLLHSVAPTVLARLQEDTVELKRYVLLLFELMAVLVLPLSIGLCLTIHEVVLVVLGSKWERAVPLVQAMSLLAVAKSFSPLAALVLVSTGNSAEPRRQALLGLAVMPLAFVVGSVWGALGVAAAWTLVYPILSFYQLRRALTTVGVRFSDVLHAIRPALYGTVVMTVAVVSLHLTPLSSTLPASVWLAVLVLSGAAAYLATLLSLAKDRVQSLIALVRNRA